jgi:hypothetical protein
MTAEGRLRPIRFDPKYRWYFVVDDINDRYARAMFNMDLALWTAEDDLRRLTGTGTKLC